MEATITSTLFERIGGKPAVTAAVDIFYRKVMADFRVSHFFRHIDMKKQSGMLKTFMAYAFGAPIAYDGKSMHQAHKHMHITEMHFNAVAGHLVETLRELNVDQPLIDEVVSVVMTTKNDIVSPS